MVKITHGTATSLPELDVPVDSLAGIRSVRCSNSGWADWKKKHGYGQRDREGVDGYVTFNISRVNELLNKGCDLIYGRDITQLELELAKRHPSPPGTKKFIRVSEYWHNVAAGKHNAGRYLVLDYPWVPISSSDDVVLTVSTWLATLQSPILISVGGLPQEFKYDMQVWRELGYVVSPRAPDMLLINYKPRQAARTAYKSKQAEYNAIMRGYFDYDAMKDLREVVGVKEWPSCYDTWRDVLTTKTSDVGSYGPHTDDEKAMSGWTRPNREKQGKFCIAYCGELAEEILELMALAKKISATARHASHRHWYRTNKFISVMSDLLPHLHGVEAFLKGLDKDRRDSFDGLTRFCRFLRREAKANELTIPDKPKPPKLKLPKPKPKKRAKKRKVKRGTTDRPLEESRPAADIHGGVSGLAVEDLQAGPEHGRREPGDAAGSEAAVE